MNLVQGSVRLEWRKYVNLSIEKIATMTNMPFRRAAQGFLTLVTGLCGIFLFSMMEAEEKRPESNTLIYVVGFIGLASSTGSVVSETYSSLKAQRKRIKLSQSGENLPEQADDRDKPVDECSWVFIVIR